MTSDSNLNFWYFDYTIPSLFSFGNSCIFCPSPKNSPNSFTVFYRSLVVPAVQVDVRGTGRAAERMTESDVANPQVSCFYKATKAGFYMKLLGNGPLL